MKSHIVYKFECVECNSTYVGFTTRYYQTRVKEHLETDKSSHIYKHLHKNEKCKQMCSENCFEILDRANSEYELRIKEAIYIRWQAPDINKQTKSYKLTLNF